ncbi:16S rRNA (guanine(966)-N(2))-methyltransferase RsmD [Candidatus Tremblaya phenacola]|uniref:Ribosomal RNA small subunit methyltransferase D n=1 Tax=Candidatus Tremblayella phenacoccinincola TaxID=1010676 RepID=A0A2G0V6Q8_9PROT|nr:16S rRNA (guanine(966)-N(2))-methyltransferase RsmD [Candidatus Tremblaya phenacola]PHN16171.1 Ribosomal RNA small subunit methyltransferase D [Candidatus Tremblaya phenacola]
MNYNIRTKRDNKVHIIGGKLKKTNLTINNDYNLRPTTNRTRKTLFSWLDSLAKGYYCLDCFAGSGGLGIEAISRYSLNVTFLESNVSFYNSLIHNINRLKINNISLVNICALEWLSNINNPKPFDIVFIDPPYFKGMVSKTIELLESFNYLSHNSIIYIETEISQSTYSVPKSWIVYMSKTTYKISYKLYIRS